MNGKRVCFLLALLVLAVARPVQGEWKPDQADVAIPLRDGKSLSADIYLPPNEGKYPTVLIQTPYNKALLRGMIGAGQKRHSEIGRGAESDLAVLRDRDHYAYVVVDWRGFFASKAAAEGVRKPLKRGLDGYDCVEWIAKQPWSDGKIGTWGGSALGRIQLDTAVEKPPHLVCAVPLIAPLGQRYEDYYEGGILLEAHVKTLDRLGFGVSGLVKRFPHPEAPLWAMAKRATYKPEAIAVPCLFITGWWDNFPGAILSTFDDVRAKGGGNARQSRLLVGPWAHVSIGVSQQGDLAFAKAANASGAAAKMFFDRWLRGLDNGWDQTPESRVWQIGDDRWIDETPRGAARRAEETLTLGAGGAYASDPADPSPTLGGANLPPLKYGPTDHSPLDARKDRHVWKVVKKLCVNGAPQLTFEATIDKESCDFIARFCEVRDGKPYLLADAARRVKAQPGERTRVTLDFPPTAVTTGELRIYVTSTNWPRYARHEGVVAVTVHDGATLKIPTLR